MKCKLSIDIITPNKRYRITKIQDTITNKWIWMMDYCKKRGVSPSQTWMWEQAEKEYNKTRQKKLKKNTAEWSATGLKY